MKLYEVPKGSLIRILADAKEPPAHRPFVDGEILKFGHIDGMYSFCRDSHGQVVHLVAWAEVEVVTPEQVSPVHHSAQSTERGQGTESVMSEPRFDIRYDRHGPSVDYHFCREWDGDEVRYGTNPYHGFTWNEAVMEMIQWHQSQIDRWRTLSFERWRGDDEPTDPAPEGTT